MSRRIRVPSRSFGDSDAQASSTARSAPAHLGILVVGSSGTVLYANAEALRILCFPETVKETGFEETLRSKTLKGKTRAMLTPLNSPFRVERSTHLMSGRRHYCCRQIAVRLQGERKAVLLIERAPSTSPLLPGLCSGHGLTSRELEVVSLLTQGFTNKEIATRMAVSVNTVKAFVRCVMLKIGVTTRAGIVGRLFNETFRHETEGAAEAHSAHSRRHRR